MISVFTILATLVMLDEKSAHNSASECYDSYTEVLNKVVSDEVDHVTVRVLENTSIVAFSRGSLGDVGEFSKDYKQHFSCITSNENERVLSITETQLMPVIFEDTPLLTEFSDNYVDDEKRFFYIYGFKLREGVLEYQEMKKYNNTQLYEHLISTIDNHNQ
jgi:hypothetical protein